MRPSIQTHPIHEASRPFGCARGLQLLDHNRTQDAASRENPTPEIATKTEGAIRLPGSGPASIDPDVHHAAFRSQLVAMIPHVRAFARSLTSRGEAEDLAQETMLRAWTARRSFEAGTNLKAWLFTILRNSCYSRARRAWRTQPLAPGLAENILVANDDPGACEDLVDLRVAMLELPLERRQSLALVGVAGLTYAEAAVICGCAVGTVKSRVSRARVELAASLIRRQVGHRAKSDISSSTAFEAIMQDAAEMQAAHRAP